MPKTTSDKKIITAAMMGNILEYYDFTLFVYLTPILGPLFFPSDDKMVSIIASLGTYALGYVVRPLGGVFFGYIGDTYGRKQALTLSILLMAVPTCLMGFLPSYQTIGIAAPILLILLRLAQGLSAGGEYNGAAIFTVENVKEKGAGFAGGMITSSSAIGGLAGSCMAMIVTLPFMPSWAWRIAFLLGLLIAFIGFYIRSRIDEAHLDRLLKKRDQLKQVPLFDALKNHRRSVIATIGIVAFSGIMYNVSFSYVSIFLTSYQKWPLSQSLLIMSIGMLVYIAFSPLSGFLSDKYGEKKVMLTGATATLIAAYPCFTLLTQGGSVIKVMTAQAALALLAAWFQGSMNLLMPKLFPMESRYSGLGFSYGLGIGIFGGTTAMISTILVKWTGNPLSPLLYLTLGCVLGLLGVIFSKPLKINN